jgi:hypothetical protein
MGIATTKSFADVAEGTQVEVLIGDGTFDPEGRFGPAVEFALDVMKPEAHAGDTILSTFSLSQPRLSKVRDLRADGLDDAAIAGVLEKKGFVFDKIDDDEEPRLGGALLRIVKACYGHDARAIKKLLDGCDTFHDLAEALVGKRFVATTRKDKNDRTRIDGKGEFYPVVSEEVQQAANAARQSRMETEEDEDFADIPF